jgi:hypothetical protein
VFVERQVWLSDHEYPGALAEAMLDDRSFI